VTGPENGTDARITLESPTHALSPVVLLAVTLIQFRAYAERGRKKRAEQSEVP